MCLLAIYHRALPDAPVLIAANREEAYDRPTIAPAVLPGDPPVLCGLDARAGGTWLGVNSHGLVVAVTNRAKSIVSLAPRSRGLLCRELLNRSSAAAAADQAVAALNSGQYAGANFLCADRLSAWVIHGGDRTEAIELSPGLHLLTNGNVDDPADQRQQLARRLFGSQAIGGADDFVQQAAKVCSVNSAEPEGVPIVVRLDGRGTVSSTLIALTSDPSQVIYRHAPGAPDRTPYQDLSRAFRQLLEMKK